jgi:hypothetical protein
LDVSTDLDRREKYRQETTVLERYLPASCTFAFAEGEREDKAVTFGSHQNWNEETQPAGMGCSDEKERLKLPHNGPVQYFLSFIKIGKEKNQACKTLSRLYELQC